MAFKKMLDLRDRRARFHTERAVTVRRPDRPEPLRTRKRKARLMIVVIVILISALIALAITVASHYERFLIKTISVQGTRDISQQSIRDYILKIIDDSKWKYFSQKNIFSFDQDAIEQGLVKDMPRIKRVVLSRPSRFSQTLQVAIDERRPAALWCKESGACYQMDDSGYIFDEASSITVTSYSFDGGIDATSSPIGQIFARGHMQDMLALLERLRKAGFTAGGVTVDSKDDYRAHLIKGYDLKISFGVNANALVRDLELVLTSDALKALEGDLAYVDLRFGNRVYFKMKGENAAETRQ